MSKTLREIIVESKVNGDYEMVAGLFYELNSDMKAKHFKGLSIKGVDVNTKIDPVNNSFSEVRKIYDAGDIKKDIDSLALFAISSFVFLNSDANQFIPLDRNVVLNHIEFVKDMVPSLVPGDSYHSDIVEGKIFTYYEDYMLELRNRMGHNVNNGNSNNLAKSYSTPAGRAFAEKSGYDAAFVNVIFYPVMVAAILIVSAVIMITINILK